MTTIPKEKIAWMESELNSMDYGYVNLKVEKHLDSVRFYKTRQDEEKPTKISGNGETGNE